MQDVPDGRSIRGVTGAGFVVLVAYTLLMVSNAAVDMLVSVILLCAWVAVAIGWLVLLRRKLRWRESPPSTRTLVGIPVAAAVVAVVVVQGYALGLRFAASEDAPRDVVAAHLAGEDLPERAGWYDVSRVETVGEGEVRLYVGRAYVSDAWGFSYLHEGDLDPIGEVRHRHLEGRWYTFVEGRGS